MKKILFAIATLLLLANCTGGQGGNETDAESKDSVKCVLDTAVPAVTQEDTLPADYSVKPVSDSVQTLVQADEAESDMDAEKESFTVEGVTFTMIRVEPGTFMMGCAPNQEEDAWDEEKPRHQVTLTQPYYIGETQVTQALWQAVMGNNPSYVTGDLQRPVERVSWNDCQEFIEKLNELTGKQFTLPTEAQWEYAARGGNRSKGFKYAGSDDLDEVAWWEGNSNEETHPVKTKAPNELGIYDMSGNVWEWCQDCYDSYPQSCVTDPLCASGSRRVLRGGSWINNARICRSSHRDYDFPDYYNFHLGFRLAFVP
ncbi:MAG: formylglycine-generating enzyme family protein [Paludibacteraceae bacterium]|nr:formylglycine-generating enzyme family protein [Paludibacteraceae bacterium]